jgi:hAT family C-terminal dimerisation region
MTEQQFKHAEEDLIDRLVTMREAECGARALIPEENGSNRHEDDDNDDVYEVEASSERQAAWHEYQQYCRLFKRGSKYPTFKREGLLSIGSIEMGVVEERGEDVVANHPFVTCNLADFIDDTGYFNLNRFLGVNKQSFPYLNKLAGCLASLRTNEVGCERFFSVAGYVSNPRRTSLKVRNYEAIAMLKRNMQHIYIDEKWVVQEYTKMEKDKDWDSLETQQDDLVVALEQEIYANENGVDIDFEEGNEPIEPIEPIEVESDSDSSTDSESPRK